LLQNTRTTLVGCLFLPPPSLHIHHYHPHRDVAEATTVDDGHETATDKVRQERRAGRTGNDDESRGRGDGLWSPSPKNRTFAFQISPILLTKAGFHHSTQRLAAPPSFQHKPSDGDPPLPFQWNKGFAALILLKWIPPLSFRWDKGCTALTLSKTSILSFVLTLPSRFDVVRAYGPYCVKR